LCVFGVLCAVYVWGRVWIAQLQVPDYAVWEGLIGNWVS